MYCGKNLEAEVRVIVPRSDAGLAYGVVMKLLEGLEEKGHYVVMNHFFALCPFSKIYYISKGNLHNRNSEK